MSHQTRFESTDKDDQLENVQLLSSMSVPVLELTSVRFRHEPSIWNGVVTESKIMVETLADRYEGHFQQLEDDERNHEIEK